MQHLISLLNKAFTLKDLGSLSYFLGIEVHHTNSGPVLSQTKYISELLEKSKMADAKPLPTPMISGLHLSEKSKMALYIKAL